MVTYEQYLRYLGFKRLSTTMWETGKNIRECALRFERLADAFGKLREVTNDDQQ